MTHWWRKHWLAKRKFYDKRHPKSMLASSIFLQNLALTLNFWANLSWKVFRTDTYLILISTDWNYLFLTKIPGNPNHERIQKHNLQLRTAVRLTQTQNPIQERTLTRQTCLTQAIPNQVKTRLSSRPCNQHRNQPLRRAYLRTLQTTAHRSRLRFLSRRNGAMLDRSNRMDFTYRILDRGRIRYSHEALDRFRLRRPPVVLDRDHTQRPHRIQDRIWIHLTQLVLDKSRTRTQVIIRVLLTRHVLERSHRTRIQGRFRILPTHNALDRRHAFQYSRT